MEMRLWFGGLGKKPERVSWRGEIVKHEAGFYQVIIRKKTIGYTTCIRINSENAPDSGFVQVTSNGVLYLSPSDMNELNAVVQEARVVLKLLDSTSEKAKFQRDARKDGFPLRDTFPYSQRGNPNMNPWG